jgi:hypothetical protein
VEVLELDFDTTSMADLKRSSDSIADMQLGSVSKRVEDCSDTAGGRVDSG